MLQVSLLVNSQSLARRVTQCQQLLTVVLKQFYYLILKFTKPLKKVTSLVHDVVVWKYIYCFVHGKFLLVKILSLRCVVLQGRKLGVKVYKTISVKPVGTPSNGVVIVHVQGELYKYATASPRKAAARQLEYSNEISSSANKAKVGIG
jgi:hypothetical protein